MSYDYLCKTLVLGNCGVGKSKLVEALHGTPWYDGWGPTLGLDFQIYTRNLGGNLCIKHQVWDTAGSERFRTITSSYYRGAHVVLLVFDGGDRRSFESIPQWVEDARKHNPDIYRWVLIASKADLAPLDPAFQAQAKAYALQNTMPFIVVSSKTSVGIEQLKVAMDEYALQPPNSVHAYRHRKCEEACQELERCYNSDPNCFAGIWIPRDVLKLLTAALKNTKDELVWGVPPSFAVATAKPRPRCGGCSIL